MTGGAAAAGCSRITSSEAVSKKSTPAIAIGAPDRDLRAREGLPLGVLRFGILGSILLCGATSLRALLSSYLA